MKYITITTLAAMLLGTVGAFAVEASAVMKPSGFVVHTLKAGQFNLVGLTLHEPVTVTSSFDAVSGTTLTDSEVIFDTALTAGKTYILEIIDAAYTPLNGTIQEVTDWSGNTITTPQNLVADGLAVGDKYQLRQAASLQDVFGSPPALKSTASAASSDVIWIADGSGGFTQYFYKTSLGGGASWHNATTNTTVTEPISICFTDAVMVQVQPSSPDVNLVVTGSVKTGKIAIAVANGFNLVSNVYPVGSTLQNSGIATSLKSTASAASSDVIWLPDGTGNFVQYFYKTSLGGGSQWYNVATNSPVASDVTMTSAFFIQRAGVATNVDLDAPTGYENL